MSKVINPWIIQKHNEFILTSDGNDILYSSSDFLETVRAYHKAIFYFSARTECEACIDEDDIILLTDEVD